jgi:TRAP-type C4-dicarboxylate transport system permease small subunit
MQAAAERWLGIVFGLMLLALSAVVTVETLARKLFNVSLQGADELGGYTLAIGATIAFSLALMGRTHIRVDVFHDALPRGLQSALNLLSILSMAALATLLAVLAWFVIQDTRAYGSVAPTPWATPLVIPQTVWLIGLIVFCLLSLGFAARALWLVASGRREAMDREFGPRTTKEEVEVELEDLALRSGPSGLPAGAAASPRAMP